MRWLIAICLAGLVLGAVGCATYTDVIGPDDLATGEASIDPALGTGVLACTSWEYAVWEADEGCTAAEPCAVPEGWEPFGARPDWDGRIHIRRCLSNE